MAARRPRRSYTPRYPRAITRFLEQRRGRLLTRRVLLGRCRATRRCTRTHTHARVGEFPRGYSPVGTKPCARCSAECRGKLQPRRTYSQASARENCCCCCCCSSLPRCARANPVRWIFRAQLLRVDVAFQSGAFPSEHTRGFGREEIISDRCIIRFSRISRALFFSYFLPKCFSLISYTGVTVDSSKSDRNSEQFSLSSNISRI